MYLLLGCPQAGLFAGVNTAFLALTLPQLSANPTDDTNALLLHLVIGGNRALNSSDLPSASFHPAAGIFSVNVLLSMSLTLALLCAFLAVLGQQWPVHYRKRSGGGAEHQRWEQLRRYLGAKRWRLELILDDVLPSLLQIGLIIFCISFVMYLGTLSNTLCYVIAGPMCTAATILFAIAIFAAWDQWCPFKSPLAPLMRTPLRRSIALSGKIAAPCIYFVYVGLKRVGRSLRLDLWSRHRSGQVTDDVETESAESAAIDVANAAFLWFTSATHHVGEDPETLKVASLKRVLCTSEDPNALVYAAVNLQAIKRKESLQWLLGDSEFHDHLQVLYRAAFEQSVSGNWMAIEGRAFSSSFAYLMLSAGSIEDLLPSEERALWLERAAQRGYAYDLISRVQSDIGQLVWGTNLLTDSPCVTCPHCVSLAFCMNVARGTILPHFHLLRAEDFDQVMDLMDKRAPLSLVSAVAWAIAFLKRQWASTDSTGRVDNLRSFLGIYRVK